VDRMDSRARGTGCPRWRFGLGSGRGANGEVRWVFDVGHGGRRYGRARIVVDTEPRLLTVYWAASRGGTSKRSISVVNSASSDGLA